MDMEDATLTDAARLSSILNAQRAKQTIVGQIDQID
jgi:hypothetical protein